MKGSLVSSSGTRRPGVGSSFPGPRGTVARTGGTRVGVAEIGEFHDRRRVWRRLELPFFITTGNEDRFPRCQLSVGNVIEPTDAPCCCENRRLIDPRYAKTQNIAAMDTSPTGRAYAEVRVGERCFESGRVGGTGILARPPILIRIRREPTVPSREGCPRPAWSWLVRPALAIAIEGTDQGRGIA